MEQPEKIQREFVEEIEIIEDELEGIIGVSLDYEIFTDDGTIVIHFPTPTAEIENRVRTSCEMAAQFFNTLPELDMHAVCEKGELSGYEIVLSPK